MGSEEITAGRSSYTAYRLHVINGEAPSSMPMVSLQRFSVSVPVFVNEYLSHCRCLPSVDWHLLLRCCNRGTQAFVDLLPKVAKEVAPLKSEPLMGALEGWKKQLGQEKMRHTGVRARGETVVNARCQLLQQMLDSLMSFQPVAHSMAMAIFLSGDGSS